MSAENIRTLEECADEAPKCETCGKPATNRWCELHQSSFSRGFYKLARNQEQNDREAART